MSFVVGLTGGIGSGKSTVAECFSSLGVAVVDTDVIAHALTVAQGAAMPDIQAAFGESVLLADGGLDRAAMRRLVFSDPSAKSRLEAIIHPLIRHESELRCRLVTGVPYVMLVVPLLIESAAYRQRVNRILVVDCDEDLQISRVMARSGLSDKEVRSIIATQASREQRLAAADDVVFNTADREYIREQVIALHRRYLDLTTL
ncbi:dephospho-CoA kinase [Propionivibrio sp.]|uniref:dephospho-CoA kinase n=1 Tax=Propionivibrio sp. TaxID=2212460 RepID=UPI0025F8FED3|nr:dephospho-CoA kinase [Propionivibrio sp.]MBK7355297.1 dephospho-CoA kinase [Propionivibrio sp.]MBK8744986.1 dephospho-CoA kinase [Propionivibrio sp.]MBL0207047.1 dephospho-CoA kinase [Propionivibrio sp.]